MAVVVRRLPAPLRERDELVAEVDEGRPARPATERQLEDPAVELKCLVDVADFERNVIDPDGSRSHLPTVNRPGIVLERVMRRFAWLFAVVVVLAATPQAAADGKIELLQCLDAIPTLVGTRGDDVLAGTTGDDVIAGLGGNDVIAGAWGNDVICGGDGADRIETGIGLFESDLVSGDGGDDLIVAGPIATAVVYAFAPGPVHVDLESGTATGWGKDTLVGVHNVVGTEFGDVLRGDGGFNCLDGLGGDDVLLALAGDDCLYGGTGKDTVDGGVGSDVLSFLYAGNRVVVNLAAGTSRGEGADRLQGVERVVGSSFRDVLTGDAGANELTGAGGADRIAGGPGTDRLDGGGGRDRVDGGVGRDRCLNAEKRSRCP
jgi:Ca2+-binding RTX toxin-like protein